MSFARLFGYEREILRTGVGPSSVHALLISPHRGMYEVRLCN